MLLLLLQNVAVDHFEHQLVAKVFDGWRHHSVVSKQQYAFYLICIFMTLYDILMSAFSNL